MQVAAPRLRWYQRRPWPTNPKNRQKLKARLPRGLADRGPAEIAATRAMVEKIREVFERYGFEPVETPAMEYTDALGKFLPDQDRPNEGVFSFQDDDEQWISLRYDLTAPLARYVAENFDSLPKPYRSYREGYVYRNEKPGPGRFRQFMQFDADTVGSASPAADAEMCMMAADTMEALGIPRGSYVVKVNNRKVLDGVMESIGLGGEENAGTAAYGAASDRQAGSTWSCRTFASCLVKAAKMKAEISRKERDFDESADLALSKFVIATECVPTLQRATIVELRHDERTVTTLAQMICCSYFDVILQLGIEGVRRA